MAWHGCDAVEVVEDVALQSAHSMPVVCEGGNSHADAGADIAANAARITTSDVERVLAMLAQS